MPQMPQMPPGSLFLIPSRPCNPRLKKSPRPLLKITSVSSVSSVGTLILPLRYLCFSKIFSLPLSRNTIKTLRTSMATAYVSSTCPGGATFCRSITSFKGTGLAMCAICLTNKHPVIPFPWPVRRPPSGPLRLSPPARLSACTNRLLLIYSIRKEVPA